MCGIFGIISKLSNQEINTMIDRGHKAQAHRGPDMNGSTIIQLSDGYSLALGHQRLSILDLSEAGRQPMIGKDGKSTICYNGEIYNYIEIAQELGVKVDGQSDTAIMLEAFHSLGVRDSLHKMNGMWSFIYYDEKLKKIFLSRDRVGEKPLYYCHYENTMVIASELKTLLAIMDRKFDLNPQVIGEYIEQSLQDTSNKTWFKDIYTLNAASCGEVSIHDNSIIFNENNYWMPDLETKNTNLVEATKNVKFLIEDAVKIRLRADVPIGITLSGGVDSSINAAIMSKHIDPSRINAFSSVSPGQHGDESEFVESITKGLGIKSNCLDLSWQPSETVDLMKIVTWHNDAPIGSFSNIAFYKLMQASAAQGVKVVISGQGADEIFCGYKKFFFWSLKEDLKNFKIISFLGKIFSSLIYRTVLFQFNFSESKRYLKFTSEKKSVLTKNILKQYNRLKGVSGDMSHRQWGDINKFSVPYLTHYEDRGSMAHAVEVRLPFLDHRVVEAGLRLSTEYKICGPWTKFILRKAFEDIVPSKNIWRKDKQGFTNAQEDLMRGQLKNTIEEIYTSEDSLIYKLNIISKDQLLLTWNKFLKKDRHIWYREVFAPWALEVWLQEFKEYINIEN